MDNLPPHNLDAEEIVLSAILHDNNTLPLVMTMLEPEDFYYPMHKLIFTSIVNVYRKNQVVDFTTIWFEIVGNNNQDGIKNKLSTILARSFYQYRIDVCCQKIKEDFVKRKYLAVLHEKIKDVYDPEADIGSILQETAEISLELSGKLRSGNTSGLRIVGEVLPEAISFLEELNQDGQDTITCSTGLYDYDKLTGGLLKGGITVVAGRPGSGKTTTTLEILTNVARMGKSVALFSLEMSDIQVVLKMLARLNIEINPKTQIHASQLFRSKGLSNIGDMGWLASSSEALSELNFWIDPFSNPDVSYIRNKLTELASSKKMPDVVAIDYVGIMKSSNKHLNRAIELDGIMKELRILAKDFNIALIAVAQLNRGIESRQDKKPQIQDLRESGGLENEAAVVTIIHNPRSYNPESDKILELHVLKNRYGPTGVVTVGFEPEYGRLLNLA